LGPPSPPHRQASVFTPFEQSSALSHRFDFSAIATLTSQKLSSSQLIAAVSSPVLQSHAPSFLSEPFVLPQADSGTGAAVVVHLVSHPGETG
jgi:hypothetical protein